MYRVQVRKSDQIKPWYWRIVAANGQVIATSETYKNKWNAKRAAEKFAYNTDMELEDE